LNEQIQQIKSKIIQLQRVQNVAEDLRKISRFLFLVRKLKGHLQTGSRELTNAAQSLVELGIILFKFEPIF
jgi:hypothetical protein